jgi:hypothetical protein
LVINRNQGPLHPFIAERLFPSHQLPVKPESPRVQWLPVKRCPETVQRAADAVDNAHDLAPACA